MKKTLLPVAAIACLLSGCAHTPVYYNTAGAPKESLAYLETANSLALDTAIEAVYAANGKRIFGTDEPFGQNRFKRIFLQPGRYRVLVSCTIGVDAHASPSFDIALSSGDRYRVTCRPVRDGRTRMMEAAVEAIP
ncbi:MAG: hypothetical protein KA144_06555 [Xanthomonadaceae bacterium]|nr:hypothetical protein [Xanthomonadaceae bacterium]